MVSHNYITASKATAAIVTLLLLLTVGGGDLYSASAINYSSSSKQQLRHRRQNTPAAKKTATTTTQEQRGLNSYNNDDGYDTNSIFKTEKDTKCTRSITNHNHGRNCIMTCQTTTFVYTHDDILLDKTVSENSVRKCTYDEEEIMVESDEGSSTHGDGYDDGLEFDVWRGSGNDDSWKCSTKKRTWQGTAFTKDEDSSWTGSSAKKMNKWAGGGGGDYRSYSSSGGSASTYSSSKGSKTKSSKYYKTYSLSDSKSNKTYKKTVRDSRALEEEQFKWSGSNAWPTICNTYSPNSSSTDVPSTYPPSIIPSSIMPSGPKPTTKMPTITTTSTGATSSSSTGITSTVVPPTTSSSSTTTSTEETTTITTPATTSTTTTQTTSDGTTTPATTTETTTDVTTTPAVTTTSSSSASTTSTSTTTTTFLPDDYYEYTTEGQPICVCPRCETVNNFIQINGTQNIQGPAPLLDKSNVVVQFYAFADTPYDNDSETCVNPGTNNTCPECAERDLPFPNNCTYIGDEYACVKDSIIPFMNSNIKAGEASFIAHAGDIFGGGRGVSQNKKCNEHLFQSRQDLFKGGTNLLLTTGDNDWNECFGYNKTENSDTLREKWRDLFARDDNFTSFSRTFSTIGRQIGGTPTIKRKNLVPSPPIDTVCIKIETGGAQFSEGFIDVFVNNGTTGYIKVSKDEIYNKSETVLDVCYNDFLGIQVTNNNKNAWAGSITSSVDNGETYLPMKCQDCNGSTSTASTKRIVVDGNVDGFNQAPAQCLDGINGKNCTLVNVPEEDNPELYFFRQDNTAFFGLNRVARESYASDVAIVDPNQKWVKDQLALDDSDCTLTSIVLITQVFPKQDVYTRIEEHFVDKCNKPKPPTLIITGDSHPPEYCMTKADEKIFLTVEAFDSGPILVSVVRDTDTGKGDFFHVESKEPGCDSFEEIDEGFSVGIEEGVLTYDAFTASFGSGSRPDVGTHSGCNAFSTDGGFADFGGVGSWIQFNNVDGGSGGVCSISFTYANADVRGNSRPGSITVNGVSTGFTLDFVSTPRWNSWATTEIIQVNCNAGNNVIRVTATGEGGTNGGPNICSLESSVEVKPPTNVPTKRPTPNPTFRPVTPRPEQSSPVNTVNFVPAPSCPNDTNYCLRNSDFNSVDTSKYNIDMSLEVSTLSNTDAFIKARERWMQMIIGNLPSIASSSISVPSSWCTGNTYPRIIDDIHICVKDGPIDGAGRVLGYARPMYARKDQSTGKWTTVLGEMKFDSPDIPRMKAQGTFDAVILHEMGHVIGIGTLWKYNELVNDNFVYLGSRGRQVWRNIWGCSSNAPPIEQDGGPGTKGAHWDEGCMRNEFMTGYVNGNMQNPVSLLTIASLDDVGYTVNYNAADEYDGSDTTCCFPGVTDGDDSYSPPSPSDNGQAEAVAFGKQLLSDSILVESGEESEDLRYVGGDFVSVLYEEDGQTFEVLVSSDE